MKTQSTLLSSSSSYRETKNNNNNDASSHHLTPKTIGCMSGIFHFISRYQHRRKYLTSGKKHEKTVTSLSSSPAKSKPSIKTATTTTNAPDSPNKPNNHQRTSCHVIPRSPTLPPEIRRRSLPPPEKENSSNNHNHHHLRSSLPSPTIVARLMGLSSPEPVESTTETRRKLLGQLEKCDRDLKALKKIIDAVRTSEEKISSAVPPPVEGEDNVIGGGGGDGGGGSRGEEVSKASSKSSSVISSEQVPSPVSVLDESVTRSPTITRRKQCDGKLVHQQNRKKPGEEDNYNACLLDRINSDESTRAKSEDLTMTSPTRVKKAMKESVEQVCKDIAWGQRREIGRIGLALQDHICRDLIEETIRELVSFSSCKHLSLPLPYEACKRRLQF